MSQTTVKRLARKEVPVQLTWDLHDLCATEKAWEAECQAVQEDLTGVTQFKGKLGQDASVLLDCLNAREAFLKRLTRVATYARLRLSEDGSDPNNQANYSKVAALMSKAMAALSFIRTEILALPDGTVERYIRAESGLEVYRLFLEELLDEKPHTLSAETEEVLASLGEVHDAPYMIYERGKSSDMSFSSIKDNEGNELPVSFALYEDLYESSPDTDIRRKAYHSFVDTLKQYKNTFATAYATEVKKQVTLARHRRFQSVTEMLLHPQQVTLDMYHNQLDVIQSELAPHMRRYARLKKRALGLDQMMFCDLKAPLDPEFQPKTTYEEASDVILEALKVLGPEYENMIKAALTERWVDRADNIGKSTGAFCSSPYVSHPYILMTWTDTMRSAFTLAHELGHAGHFYLAGANQIMTNTRPSLYFVEAPSTMNEMLLGLHLLAQTNDTRMRRWVTLQLLGTYYHNFVTHLLEAELQRRVYTLAEDGVPITAALLCEQKSELLTKFWDDAVVMDEGAGLTWMRQPHYYMGLYPYTYSAGLTVSTAVSQKIQEEGQPAVDRWLDVLKAGGTMKPLELIRHVGVDMSQPEPIKQAVAFVGSLVDELERSFA